MQRTEKTEHIDRLVTIGYFWLGEENYNCPLTIYHLLKNLELNKKEQERVDGLFSDIKSTCKRPNEIKDFKPLTIPEPCKTQEDSKVFWCGSEPRRGRLSQVWRNRAAKACARLRAKNLYDRACPKE